MSEKKNIIVGIVASPDSGGYFGNGLHQNAYYLYRLFENVPLVTPILVYPPRPINGEPAPDSLDIFGVKAHNLELFKEKYHLDALLMVSAVFDPKYLEPFRKRGVKVAAVVYGNRYVMDQETTAFGHLLHPQAEEGQRNSAERNLLREDVPCDSVWLSPHFAWQKDYMKYRYSAKSAFVCPYIWDPELLDLKYKEHPHYEKNSPFFEPGNENNKSIFCTDPNINVVKTCLFTYQAANLVLERGNAEFDKLYLYNSYRVAVHNPSVSSYFAKFPLWEQRKVAFEHRYGLPTITKNAKMMFHHHFQNGLNYTLLEAARFRLPVVHNSEFMPELGYYYKDANITDAARQIEAALAHEDRNDLEEYNETCNKVIEKYWINNIQNRRGYQTLLANLLNNKIEPELPDYINNIEQELGHSTAHISPLKF